MSVTHEIKLTDESKRMLASLSDLRQKILRSIADATDLQHQATIGHIQEKRMSADKFNPPRPPSEGVLRTLTNRLRGSLRASKATISESGVTSAIWTNVKYAGPNEFGSKPHKILPKKGKALKFEFNGNTLYRRSVNHPGTPARAPIRRGIEDRLPQYEKALSRAVVEACQPK
jgi:hypothetical protein